VVRSADCYIAVFGTGSAPLRCLRCWTRVTAVAEVGYYCIARYTQFHECRSAFCKKWNILLVKF
jgi:hypothetical protein